MAKKLDYKDTAIRAAKFTGLVRLDKDGRVKGGETEYRIAGHDGLILTVHAPNGGGTSSKTWRFQYSFVRDGKQVKRKVRLGQYPITTLADAGREAAKLRSTVEAGRDPVSEQRAALAASAQGALTVADLIMDYITQKRAGGLSSVDEIERAFNHDVIPVLGSRRASTVTDTDIQALLDGVMLRKRERDKARAKVKGEAYDPKTSSGSAMARHLLVYLRGLFNYVLVEDRELKAKYGIVENPALLVGRASSRGKGGRYGKGKPKRRFLTEDEIATFWRALEASETDKNTKRAAKLLLLGGQRTIEIRMAVRSEVQMGEDKKPVLLFARTKNEESHVVPLPPLSHQIVNEALEDCGDSDFLFPAPTEEGCMGDGTLRQAIDRLFDAGRLGSMPRFTPHDLRRTVKTHLARLGIPQEVRDAVQNHKPKTIGDQVYNVWTYLPEKRAALERWEQHVLRAILPAAKPTAGKRRASLPGQ